MLRLVTTRVHMLAVNLCKYMFVCVFDQESNPRSACNMFTGVSGSVLCEISGSIRTDVQGEVLFEIFTLIKG